MENDKTPLTCDKGRVIKITYATYAPIKCGINAYWKYINANDGVRILGNICNGKTSCVIEWNVDPSPGCSKSTEVEYSCLYPGNIGRLTQARFKKLP